MSDFYNTISDSSTVNRCNNMYHNISTYESSVFQRVLKWKGPKFTNEFQESLVEILGRMGCRIIPAADTIHQLVIEVARYELCIKPLGAVQVLRVGVPTEFYPFWNAFSVKQLHYCTSTKHCASLQKLLLIVFSLQMT